MDSARRVMEQQCDPWELRGGRSGWAGLWSCMEGRN